LLVSRALPVTTTGAMIAAAGDSARISSPARPESMDDPNPADHGDRISRIDGA
jgi:hypothetical protein